MQGRIINLPFPGFYESTYSGEVDSQEEREAEYFADELQKEDGIPAELRLEQGEYSEILLDCTDYNACYLKIAKSYVDAFSQVISEYIGIELGLKFESMTSPREYNFETDRLFAYISEETLAALFAASVADKHAALAKQIRERFTSCSGFISHYDNDLETWLEKPLADWDHNELGTLLLAAMARSGYDESDLEIYYRVCDCDGVYREWSESVDWTKVDRLVEEKRAEKRAEYAEEHPDEPPLEPKCSLTLEMFP